jgi:hypothetical protein
MSEAYNYAELKKNCPKTDETAKYWWPYQPYHDMTCRCRCIPGRKAINVAGNGLLRFYRHAKVVAAG